MVCIFATQNNIIMKTKMYLRTPLLGNEFKVCDEITDEVIAIFYNKEDALEYIKFKTI